MTVAEQAPSAHPREGRWTRTAVAVWALVFCAVMTLRWAGLVPGISYDVYAAAGARWLARRDLYDLTNIDGFQYLPTSALFFAPFSLLSLRVGGLIWRALGWGLLAWGGARLAREVAPQDRATVFGVFTVATVPQAVGALGNGQANLVLAAATLHTVVELQRARWWPAALWLGLGVALKPHLAVLALLVWALYPPTRWRLPLVLGCAATLPWLLADSSYVSSQYSDFVAKLRLGTAPPARYEDLRGLLATLGWVMPHELATWVRATAAALVLAASAHAKRHLHARDGALMVGALSAFYLMVFSPRSQATTYVVVASVAAFFTARAWLRRGRWQMGLLVLLHIAWILNHHWWAAVELWLKPLAALFFGAYLAFDLWTSSTGGSATPAPGGVPP